MRILVGLGNPGPRYAATRHNVGFMVVDAIHRRHDFSPWRSRFRSEVAEGVLGGVKCLLVKPMTFMNESGQAIGEVMRYFKLAPADVIVFHDELDLPPGKMRVKSGGGHGGNNGLRSAIAHIGPDFHRVRIGIGHPGRKELVHGYILKEFARADAEWLDPLIEAIAENVPLLVAGKASNFANRVHLALRAEPDAARRGRQKGGANGARAMSVGGADGAGGGAGAAAEENETEGGKPGKGGPFAALSRLLRR